MEQHYFDNVSADVAAGLDEMSIRRRIEQYDLNKEDKTTLLAFLSEQIALRAVIDVKSTDAKLLIYLGYFFMLLSFIFMYYIGRYTLFIFGIGFIILRRGRRKLSEAKNITSIEELLPHRPTIFHK